MIYHYLYIISHYIYVSSLYVYIYQRPHVIDGYTVHSHLVSSFMDNYYLQICPNVDACSPGIFIPKKLCYFLIMFINFLCNMVSLWLFKKNMLLVMVMFHLYISKTCKNQRIRLPIQSKVEKGEHS